MHVKETSFQISLNERLFRCISRISISVVKQLRFVTAFFKNTSRSLLATFELIMDRALRGYVFVYGSKIQDIPKKSVVKALWHILLKVKTEWPIFF